MFSLSCSAPRGLSGNGISAARLCSLFICIWLLCGGCGQEQQQQPVAPAKPAVKQETPVPGDAYIDSSIGDASNLIPILVTDSASGNITDLVYNGLVKYDKDINVVGDLAECWEIRSHDKRQTYGDCDRYLAELHPEAGQPLIEDADMEEAAFSITFRMREGVRFHDGVECTAEDAMFTYQSLIDPKVPTPYRGNYVMVKQAEVLGKYTFRVSYEKPFAPALISWGMGILPKHLLEGQDLTQSPLKRKPVGTGPYKFVEWKTGEKIVLEANKDYFEGRPYIDHYIYRIIPDTATQFLELKAGGIDSMGLNPMQYLKQTDTPEFNEQYNKYRYLSFGYTYLGYNLLNQKFADKRVRQALAYAIDKQEIIDGVLMGLGKIATGPYKPGTWYYNPNVKQYPHDPQKAKQLLAEAGWLDSDNDGILDKNGQPFQFTIITNQGNDLRKKTAEIIQQRLRTVGIKVKIRIIEWAAFLKEFVDKKKFDAVILGWSGSIDPDVYNVWHSSKTGPQEYNFISYKNAEVDELLEKGRHTFDQEERKKYYFRFQEILAEEQPYTFLYVAEALPAISARFHGIEPAPLGITYNFIKWYVPKEMQRY
jgi:peptide/nickel transport system substrate-binding protein